MKKLTTVLILLISGCGQESLENTLPSRDIETRFLPDFEKFIDIAEEYGFYPSLNDVRYMQTDDSINTKGVVGVCYPNTTLKGEYYFPEHREEEYTYAMIKIVSDAKISTLKLDLKQIIYHELLHCIFKVGHSGNMDDIMYPTLRKSSISIDQRLRNKFSEILKEKGLSSEN